MVTNPSSTTATSTSACSGTQQRTSEARAAFTATLTSMGSTLDHELQTRARDIHANSAAIATQETAVSKQSGALRQDADRYRKVADESRSTLKEIGDIQNWAEMLERDLLVLEETVRLGNEGEKRDRRKNGVEGAGRRGGLMGGH